MGRDRAGLELDRGRPEDEPAELQLHDGLVYARPEARTMTHYSCTWADEEHDLLEIGFNLPDAAFALTLPEEQRAAYRRLSNEDDLMIGDAHFVRCHAPLQLEGVDQPWGLGLWVKISARDYAEFVRLRPRRHPPYRGVVANQDLLGAATLGAAVEIRFVEPVGGQERRPRIHFAPPHPLARFQAKQVPQVTWREWMSNSQHHNEPQPRGEPFAAALERDGWRILAPEEADRVPVTFDSTPRPGDAVKAVFEVLASDDDGEPVIINAGWWVVLDDVELEGLWSGTLANHTRVPTTIRLGSRVWLRPGQVVEHAPENG